MKFKKLGGTGPKYDRIHLYLKEQIEKGELIYGEYLPSEHDLARQFGVSLGTLKKALSQLKEENYIDRRRGHGTQISYKPRNYTRDLQTVAILMDSIRNPFFAEIYQGIQNTLDAHGYKPILLDSENDNANEGKALEKYASMVGGFIITPVTENRNHEKYGKLMAARLPFVFVDRMLPEMNIDIALSDNKQGGYLATKHLLEKGHRRIAIIGVREINTLQERLEGYRTALEESGVPYDETLVYRSRHNDYDTAYAAADKLLQQHGDITAAFCLRDDLAWGCMQRLSEAGINIPGDFSVIGYDDNSEICSRVRPPLTTVRQLKKDIGSAAAEMLIERIEKNVSPAPRTRQIPVELIERASVALAPTSIGATHNSEGGTL